MKFAFTLARASYAPIVVISLGGDPEVHCPRTPKGLEVICFRPNPVNTAGRGRNSWRGSPPSDIGNGSS